MEQAGGTQPGSLHETILDNLADGVYFVDPERTITYWNRGAEELTGFSAESVVGRQCYDNILKHVDGRGRPLCFGGCPLAATIADGERREVEVWLRHRDGSRRAVRVRAAPIRRDGVIVGAVEVFDDATGRIAAREAAEAARQDALTDELTGLANRRMFNLMLDARLEDLRRYGTPLGLLMVDLDRFKAVNDRLGHGAGDAVLRAVAETVRGAVRSADLAARWGGEEFVVIVNHATARVVDELGERVRSLVAQTDVPLADGIVLTPTASVGGAVAVAGDDAASLVARADAAMYRAKEAGRDRYVLAG